MVCHLSCLPTSVLLVDLVRVASLAGAIVYGGNTIRQVVETGDNGHYTNTANLIDVSLSPCSSVVRNCEAVKSLGIVDLHGRQPKVTLPRLEWVDFATPHADTWKLTLSFLETKEPLPHNSTTDYPRPEFLATFRLRRRLRNLL